jgi:glyceraldehyde 3-phosphate dehydrogenase
MMYGASAESADVPRQLFAVSPGLRGRTQLQPQVMMPAVGPAIDPALYVGAQGVPVVVVSPEQYESETHDGYSWATYFAAGATAAAAGYVLSQRPVSATADAPLLPAATAELEGMIEMNRAQYEMPVPHRPVKLNRKKQISALAVAGAEIAKAEAAEDVSEDTAQKVAMFAVLGARAQVAKARADEPQMSVNPDAPVKLGVNGFGRIGRQVVRIAMEHPEYVVKHINSPMSPEYMKYLLEHDTIHGRFKGTVEVTDTGLKVNGLDISLSATRDPTEIPWKTVGVDYVCESTGAFCTTEGCMKHIEGGAKKVVISAPAKDADTPTIVVGVNTDEYDPATMNVVSNASCTTNGLAPIVKVINDKFGIKKGLMTTVHATTASQLTVDGSMKGKDWRAGRAAAANIIPSSTGAAKAVAKCYPVMKGKLTGMAFRVPTVDVSVVDLTCQLEKPTTYEDIKAEVKLASETYAKGVVGYTEDQVVSSDFIGETNSTVFDAGAGIMLTPTFVKLVSWYDNEWGYSTRLVDLVANMAAKDGAVSKEAMLA